MAQVSLYLDKGTFGKIESAAESDGVSISKYVARIIAEHFNREWPSGYARLFGSVNDDTFFPCGAERIVTETARESL